MIAPVAAPPDNGVLIVDIGNVRNDRGVIHVDLCDERTFVKSDCRYVVEVPAQAGVTHVPLRGIPAGQYAVQATHDENNNKKVDRGLFGIPKEGVGFSRDARIMLGPPKWRDAMFIFNGRAERTTLKLRYFMGPSGPPAIR